MNKHIDHEEMAVIKKNRMYGLMSSTGNREVQNVRHDITYNLLRREENLETGYLHINQETEQYKVCKLFTAENLRIFVNDEYVQHVVQCNFPYIVASFE